MAKPPLKTTPVKQIKVPGAAAKAEKAEAKVQQRLTPTKTGSPSPNPNSVVGSAGPTVVEVTQRAPEDFAAQYGVQAALVNSTPELQGLFNQAVAEKWTAAKFNAAFMNTTWYKNNSDTWRNAEATRLTDPASWNEQLNIAKDTVRRQSVQLGFELDDAQVDQLANQALYLAGGTAGNIDATSLKTHVVETGRITGKGGTALQAMDKLKSEAYANGISYNDGWYETAAKDVLQGTGTMEAWSKQIKDAAKSKYAALASQLDAGMTVRDVVSPYIQDLSSTLERSVNDISLDDPLIQKAITNLDESGKPTIIPLWKFNQMARLDDRFFQTQKANQEFMSLATEIGRQHGKTI